VGDFISEQDESDKAKNCVIGYKLAVDLFDNAVSAFDNSITIDGTTFSIIGVLQQMGTVTSGISPDEAIYVPYSTGSKYIFGKQINPQLTVVADSTDNVQTVIDNVTILLDENYPGASFTFSDAGSKMEAAQQSSRTLSMLLMAVAAIVFLVGGIGIMNVLFVSVKERTKEIGVLKALGMQRGHVLLEFLFEAVMISVFGGAAGVGLSILIIPLAERFGIRMEPALYAYTAAFGFAVACGTIFGFYPAFKASKLIPVEALTQE
ncbi:ABC transporter permease, partial [Ruminococcaceae bacterium OttesenSCG-928-L11]|nr:ABC transporter permease [Ruminococcaceae bacterium OttesenSCG-928-L11]